MRRSLFLVLAAALFSLPVFANSESSQRVSMNNDSDVTIKRLSNGRYRVTIDPEGNGNSHDVEVSTLSMEEIEKASAARTANWSDRNKQRTRDFFQWMRTSEAVRQVFSSYSTGTDAARDARVLESDARAAAARANNSRNQRDIRSATNEVERIKGEIERTNQRIALLCTGDKRQRNQAACESFENRLVALNGELTEAERVLGALTAAVAAARSEAEAYSESAAANRGVERTSREQAAYAATRMQDIRNRTFCCGDSKFQERAMIARFGGDYCAGATSLNEYSSQAVLNQGGMAVNSNQAKWACNGIEKMCFGRARCAYIDGETVIPFEGDVSCGFGAQGSCGQTTACFRQNEGGIRQGNAIDELPAAGFQPASRRENNTNINSSPAAR